MLKNKRYIIILSCVFLIMFSGSLIIKAFSNSDVTPKAAEASSIGTESQEESTIITDNVPAQIIPRKPEIIKYTVKQGDTLESIASLYNVDVNSIAESSGISKEDILKEGRELTFPSVTGVVHKVKNGDTLWDISTAYKMEIDKIVSANDMKSPDSLKIGQQLIIPGAEKLKTIENGSNQGIMVASRGSSSSVRLSISGIWPVSGTITSWFGSRWGSFHKGIDIGASTGTPVYAYADGKVVFSGWDNGGYGYLVIINHGNGVETYYGHNSKLLVSAGQEVHKGDRIANV